MRLFLGILISVLFLGCNSENAPGCIQSTGNIITKDFYLESFEAIDVFDKIQLVISKEPTQKVVLETGSNLINDISVSVEDDKLVLRNSNTCNYFRDYNVTKVYISAPQLKEIRNSSGAPIISEGVLEYKSLKLISENSGKIGEYRVDGIFDLDVKCESISVVINNLCTTILRGQTDELRINYANGDARFEAQSLIANTVNVYHRGTNDIIVNPQQTIKGKLVSNGNLILVNKPSNIEVEALYNGKLIVVE